MYAFIVVAVALVAIYCYKQSEGFESKTSTLSSNKPNGIPSIRHAIGSSPIPVNGEVDRSFNPNNVQPYAMPGELPVAGYEQIGAMSPLPYQDTTLIKANRQQLVSLLEMVKGFLSFEAQEISEKSDPSIQLPLQTARSDFHVLQREVDVLNRNPGVQSTVTLTSLNEMSSNLAYLQQQVRLTGAATGSIGSGYKLQGPMNEFGTEGFDNPLVPSDRRADDPAAQNPDGPVATKQDLQEFIPKLQGEILRLSGSGTNDPIVKARVTAITNMKASVQQIIDKLDRGTLMAVEVPVLKKDLDKAFPLLGKLGQPFPDIIKQVGLPKGLANALPSSASKDPQTVRQISGLLDKYVGQFVTSMNNQPDCNTSSAKRSVPSTIDQTGFPSMSDLDNLASSTVNGDDSSVTDYMAARPVEMGRGPSHFDWKQRAKEIEGQIKQRGLQQKDFGIDPKLTSADRSKDFSWKGYTRMICTRLQATMDPGLPETCGCPPMDWKGWRS